MNAIEKELQHIQDALNRVLELEQERAQHAALLEQATTALSDAVQNGKHLSGLCEGYKELLDANAALLASTKTEVWHIVQQATRHTRAANDVDLLLRDLEFIAERAKVLLARLNAEGGKTNAL